MLLCCIDTIVVIVSIVAVEICHVVQTVWSDYKSFLQEHFFICWSEKRRFVVRVIDVILLLCRAIWLYKISNLTQEKRKNYDAYIKYFHWRNRYATATQILMLAPIRNKKTCMLLIQGWNSNSNFKVILFPFCDLSNFLSWREATGK